MTERERFEAWRATVKFPDQVTPWNVWQAALAQQREPVAWMWQHPETGMTGFVEHAPLNELAHWEHMNRPRKIITPLYTAPTTPEGWQLVPKKPTIPLLEAFVGHGLMCAAEPYGALVAEYIARRRYARWLAAVKEKP